MAPVSSTLNKLSVQYIKIFYGKICSNSIIPNLNTNAILSRLIGSIPGPVFFGAIIDQTCLLLGDSCLFYDNYSMSLYMMLIVVLVKLVNGLTIYI